ncbi:PPC domain-containing DNA-binding protein [Tepidibacter aestuarii]|uniref:PPC domain-containing DNA-binding protein n=1 Tax=Tepidibacter aestuarii TaxID=2925782 RepID=UPI0020BD5198|nr:PPC domain-containing DNA-binding protein [Tepidibacter aestuarii]CAH2213591.1 DNA-binding protein [Tepidibacter aestuarii]
MKYHVMRLKPGQDLKKEIENVISQKNIEAGIVMACIGSLNCAKIRLADENIVKEYNEKFEIISLGGTLSKNGSHLHVCLANEKGICIGGHLMYECYIYTTAEIVIGKLEDIIFKREYCEDTGFKELNINYIKETVNDNK